MGGPSDIHLDDLYTILDANPATFDLGGRTMINFTRCIAIADKLKEVRDIRAPDLGDECDTGKLAYLENQLQNARIDSHADDVIELRSRELGDSEQRIVETRERELNALGFRPPPPKVAKRPSSSGSTGR